MAPLLTHIEFIKDRVLSTFTLKDGFTRPGWYKKKDDTFYYLDEAHNPWIHKSAKNFGEIRTHPLQQRRTK